MTEVNKSIEQRVAALFVQTGGSYFGLGGVDPWDEPRDARLYAGPYPVVAHPPCQRWGKFWAGQPLWIKQGRYGHYARKPTWLLAYNVDLPELDWGVGPSRLDPELIARVGLKKAQRLGEVRSKGGGVDSRFRIATPPKFREVLLSMARSVYQQRLAA